MYIEFKHTVRIMASQNWWGLEIQKILRVYGSTYSSYIYKDASHLPTHPFGAHGYTTSNLTSTICTRRNATCHMPLPSSAAGNFLLPFGIRWWNYRPFQGPRMLASSPPVDDVKINFQPKKKKKKLYLPPKRIVGWLKG